MEKRKIWIRKLTQHLETWEAYLEVGEIFQHNQNHFLVGW